MGRVVAASMKPVRLDRKERQEKKPVDDDQRPGD
jgi:hypothetical protein